ncbi:GIY-YIG nuclease family protein [Ureibacillus aquaedulcis]|uniref:GIY-YIG nuclease family protein n=1 Tax=Ureibacillus aquaedulcis TaxID=3058421 RepID=A0ABT8GPC8_9BACL|nr:GIY-YIG nuclease family protein [Ureibacillus sp. BA0131]MDN4493094.1 GIY-YIG nuclease family protein [Ureibacillus sp. BA0131]
MENKPKSLEDIFASDELGLLDVKDAPKPITEHERLINSFEEIVEFYKENNRLPFEGNSIKERKLYYRLENIRENGEKVQVLEPYDQFGWLNKIEKSTPQKEDLKIPEVNSLNDILSSDPLGLLGGNQESIFTIKNIPEKKTTMPEYIARRKRCKDFKLFEPLLLQCQNELRRGKRKIIPFRNGDIEQGSFFVLKGVLLYVAEVGKLNIEKGVVNARLRCIFENGTESDMLLRSLSAELYKHGRRVTEHEDIEFVDVNDDDVGTGYIYVLQSLSKNPDIFQISNLYKIGFTKNTVENRIKNAEKDPTFLMAPVKIITTFECYNLNTNKLEQLLHQFFGAACLDVTISDGNGVMHKPREWFIAPLEVIEQVILLIQNRQITNFRYDLSTQSTVLRR